MKEKGNLPAIFLIGFAFVIAASYLLAFGLYIDVRLKMVYAMCGVLLILSILWYKFESKILDYINKDNNKNSNKSGENDEHSKLTKLSFRVLLIGAICTFVFPILFSSPSLFSRFNFIGKGEVGDVIGGTTAPIIGLVNAILLYLAFKTQLDANKVQLDANAEIQKKTIIENENKNIELIYIELKEKIRLYAYDGSVGVKALYLFIQNISKMDEPATNLTTPKIPEMQSKIRFESIIMLIYSLYLIINNEKTQTPNKNAFNILLSDTYKYDVMGYFADESKENMNKNIEKFDKNISTIMIKLYENLNNKAES